jgi:hypothetical protein
MKGKIMHPQKKIMLLINLIGGIAVLGSYAWGLTSHPGSGNELWGRVPQWLRLLSTADMFLAALGYLTFTAFLLVLDLETTQINLQAGFKAFNVLYSAILVPSALWMPLTYSYLAYPNSLIWLMDRLVLFIVGFASLGMLSALLNIKPRRPAWFFWLAFTGAIFLVIQTALLDALVWTTFF